MWEFQQNSIKFLSIPQALDEQNQLIARIPASLALLLTYQSSMCILFLFFLQLQIKISESQLKVRIPAKNVEEVEILNNKPPTRTRGWYYINHHASTVFTSAELASLIQLESHLYNECICYIRNVHYCNPLWTRCCAAKLRLHQKGCAMMIRLAQ